MSDESQDSPEPTGRLARLGRRLVVLRLARVSWAVLAIGIALTIGAFFLARDLVSQSQSQALLRRATSTADALKTQAANTAAALRVASAIAEATDGNAARFTELMQPRLADQIVTNIALVRIEGGRAVADASVGRREPVLLSQLTPSELAQLQAVTASGQVAGVTLRSVDGERVTLIAAPGTADGRYVVAAEYTVTALEESVPAVASEGVDWQLYTNTPLGFIPVAASTTDVPLRGPSVVRQIDLFGGTAQLVVVAKGSLVGGFRGDLHWIVLAAGLLAAVVAATLVEANRRRREAVEAQQALVAENERLLQLDRQKDEFISLISHDLRTPLTSIIGYTELLLDESEVMGDEEERRFIEIIERNGRRLLGMVEDLLFMARLQAGRLQLDLDEVDLAAIATQCVEAVRPRAEAGGVQLRLETDGLVVHGDERRLGQLADNLVSNALKFTLKGGTVTVRVEREGNSAILEVEDTGIGIPPVEVGRLFDRFYRASSATEREVPGTGLGLTIAKAIVDAHQGTITVRSTEGVGTTFRCVLPARPAQPDRVPGSDLVSSPVV